MTKCSACGGTYNATQIDGTLYFHACSPLSELELAAKVAAGKVVLPAGETAAIAVARRCYERANKRDENPSDTKDTQGKAVPKAIGDGTTTVPDPPADKAPVIVVAK